jgi:hypothetical protein
MGPGGDGVLLGAGVSNNGAIVGVATEAPGDLVGCGVISGKRMASQLDNSNATTDRATDPALGSARSKDVGARVPILGFTGSPGCHLRLRLGHNGKDDSIDGRFRRNTTRTAAQAVHRRSSLRGRQSVDAQGLAGRLVPAEPRCLHEGRVGKRLAQTGVPN